VLVCTIVRSLAVAGEDFSVFPDIVQADQRREIALIKDRTAEP
jgi:hypothetical protein